MAVTERQSIYYTSCGWSGLVYRIEAWMTNVEHEEINISIIRWMCVFMSLVWMEELNSKDHRTDRFQTRNSCDGIKLLTIQVQTYKMSKKWWNYVKIYQIFGLSLHMHTSRINRKNENQDNQLVQNYLENSIKYTPSCAYAQSTTVHV